MSRVLLGWLYVFDYLHYFFFFSMEATIFSYKKKKKKKKKIIFTILVWKPQPFQIC
jgi:hypothetical protein